MKFENFDKSLIIFIYLDLQRLRWGYFWTNEQTNLFQFNFETQWLEKEEKHQKALKTVFYISKPS